MGNAISSNSKSASELAATVEGSLAGYLGFKLSELNGDVPVSASCVHDGCSGYINTALEDWGKLIAADAKAIEDTAGVFASLDSDLAQGLLGIEGGAL